jgi:hypothetical protein
MKIEMTDREAQVLSGFVRARLLEMRSEAMAYQAALKNGMNTTEEIADLRRLIEMKKGHAYALRRIVAKLDGTK